MAVDYEHLNYYRLKSAEVLEQLGSSKTGLTQHEALERLHHIGANSIDRDRYHWALTTLIQECKNPLLLVLLAGSALSLYADNGKTAAVLIFVILMRLLRSLVQTERPDRKATTLRASVMRSGKSNHIDANEVVLGDVIVLNAGDRVPADARIIESNGLVTDDFALTGDHSPSKKFAHSITEKTPLSGRHNMVFMGAVVTAGTGRAVVIGTGNHSELGRLVKAVARHTAPFQKLYHELASNILTRSAVVGLLLVCFIPQIGSNEAAFIGVALAVALVPIGVFLKPSLVIIESSVRSALTASSAQLITVFAGLVALATVHIEPAITPVQIVAVDLFGLLLPIAALTRDQEPAMVRGRLLKPATVANIAGFGLFAAILAYANYTFFFVRQGLSPTFVEHSLPLYQQATTLTFLTLILCAYVYLLVERADTHGKVFTFHLISNNQLIKSLAVSLFLVGVLIYHPWFQPLFDTKALDAFDWLSALACAGIYLLLRISQRHTRKHSRKAVLDLHRQVRGTKR